MRSPNTVVFCAIDEFIPASGNPLTGFPEFLESLAEADIPCVWLTGRNRHQLDSTLRKLGQTAPFIAEGGCCVYMAEDYFHLKPSRTIRLGRFICIPVARSLPAAADALDLVAEQTGIEVVPLRSLSPRELIQNSGLPKRDAESIRQRDFDELFFFAGASEEDIQNFRKQATLEKFTVRAHGSLWSMAVNPSLSTCISELRKLYDRAFHKNCFSIAVATSSEGAELLTTCDRSIVMTDRSLASDSHKPTCGAAPKFLPLFNGQSWTSALEAIETRQF